MKLYLQKTPNGAKYWIYKDGKEIGITTIQKDATDFPLNFLSDIKKKVVRQLAHYPKYAGYSVHSVMNTSGKKRTEKNTLGVIHTIVYKSADDGKLYTHTFKRKPTLIASSLKKLDIIGGNYTITDRGVVG